MSEVGKDKTPIVDVSCDVTKCIHNNHENKCTASSIKVGPHFATTTNDTICETFKEEKCCH